MLKKHSSIRRDLEKDTDKTMNEYQDKQLNNLYQEELLPWWIEKLEDYEDVPEYKVNNVHKNARSTV